MSEHARNGGEALRLTRSAESPEQFDALAELFLGGQAHDAPEATAPPAPVTTTKTDEPEPMRTAPVASSSRMTVDLAEPDDLEEEGVTIEVLMLGHLPVRSTPWVGQYVCSLAATLGEPVALVRVDSEQVTLRLFGMDSDEVPTFESIPGAMAWLADRTRRWILQVTELDEPMLATGHAIDGVTLLTGADDAAVVAAYGTIKRLAESADGWGDELGAPQLRVATMGSAPDAGRAAYERLERAAAIYLGQHLEFAANVQRMGATGSVILHEGAIDGGVERVIDHILLAGDAQGGDGVTEATPPVQEAERVQTGARESTSLASHIDARGLDVTCPMDPGIEIAVDKAGILCVLLRLEGASDVGRLLAVRAWATAHATLLARACPEAGINATATPRAHAFTPTPIEIRDLLDTDVRCHVLAQVGEAWFCAPLNG